MGRDGRTDRAVLAVHGRGIEARYKRRPGKSVLTALDFDVAPGEVVGLLGPNGAGKSSLLRLLATSLAPSAGTLVLLNHVLAGLGALRPSGALRRRIGFARDEAVHVEALTGRENAVFFARASGMGAAAAEQAASVMLEQVALAADADRPVAEYSFGMRRKLLLAEALIHDPALVVLDEPTAGLDPEAREAVRAILRRRASAGTAVVLATNDVDAAERTATRVCFLNRGRKVLEGEPADLVRRLGGATRIEFGIRAPEKPSMQVSGVEISLATTERVVAHAPDGSSPLPALCEALIRAGAAIESVEVRRPDLGDVFLRATGEELAAA